jgi:hypothetical protein
VHPITHLLIGWTLAQTVPLTRRDRALATLAGVIPDIDGLGIVAEFLTHDSQHPLLWWSAYHHVLAHNVGGTMGPQRLAKPPPDRPSPGIDRVSRLEARLYAPGTALRNRRPEGRGGVAGALQPCSSRAGAAVMPPSPCLYTRMFSYPCCPVAAEMRRSTFNQPADLDASEGLEVPPETGRS